MRCNLIFFGTIMQVLQITVRARLREGLRCRSLRASGKKRACGGGTASEEERSRRWGSPCVHGLCSMRDHIPRGRRYLLYNIHSTAEERDVRGSWEASERRRAKCCSAN